MYLGYITTISKIGDKNDRKVKVWGVNNAMSKPFLGVTGRYYF
jgi:hypothetical protein